ncbi:beta-barrel fold lipoprotein [Phocaeicola vulgatus]|jgi:hypothetical protein|uniref:beta-barrel fold lipoprotein n=1 Tax=Phocaeicola vulgatus TaxID=821 RepID=UPI0035666362
MIQNVKFSLMGIVALIACAFLVSCGDDDNGSGEIYKTGVHKIVVEQSGDTDAFALEVSFGASSISASAKLYNDAGEYVGETYGITMDKAKASCYTGDNAIYMTCSGAIHNIIDEPGKKLKVVVTAYINDKEVNRLTKEYETAQEDLIETFRVSTTTE